MDDSEAPVFQQRLLCLQCAPGVVLAHLVQSPLDVCLVALHLQQICWEFADCSAIWLPNGYHGVPLFWMAEESYLTQRLGSESATEEDFCICARKLSSQ